MLLTIFTSYKSDGGLPPIELKYLLGLLAVFNRTEFLCAPPPCPAGFHQYFGFFAFLDGSYLTGLEVGLSFVHLFLQVLVGLLLYFMEDFVFFSDEYLGVHFECA